MPKFQKGQSVKVMRGKEQVFEGRIGLVIDPGPFYYRVESQDKDGTTYSMTVEEGWLEPDESDVVWLKTDIPTLDTGALAQSLKSLCFFLGGTHVAGLVEEAEKAAWEGKAVKYE